MLIVKKPIYFALFTFSLLLFKTNLYSKSDNISIFNQDSVNIYIVKDYWHTGIRFKVNDHVVALMPVTSNFDQFNFIDIGWGDEEFYQSSDFELDLAAQAILVPSSSVLRFAGIYSEVDEFVNWVDFCIELKLSAQEFTKLIEFINISFRFDDEGIPIKTSERIGGQITFYKSKLKYHLFNTCNMWVAKAVEYTGQEIETFGIITAEQLFLEISDIGKILKFESD